MPKRLVFEIQLLNADLSVKSRQRLRVTLDTDEIEWPNIRQKLQDFCEKKGWGNCKVQFLNGTALVELCDPSSLRHYLELHCQVLVGDTATLPLYLVPDPTDGPSSSTIGGEEIVLEVDQEGSPIVLTLDSDILLGEGGFGKVLRAKDRETLAYYALKMSFKDEMSQKHMKTEISTLVRLTHPHIVSILQHGYMCWIQSVTASQRTWWTWACAQLMLCSPQDGTTRQLLMLRREMWVPHCSIFILKSWGTWTWSLEIGLWPINS